MNFPPLFDAVDTSAANSQRKLLTLRKIEFVALVSAAALSEIPGDVLWRVGPLLTFIAFALALIVRISGGDQAAERKWYDARAAAESIKSMTWQYAVGGEAYRIDDPESEQRYIENLRAILSELPDLDMAVPGATATALTDEMKSLRVSDRGARSAAYIEHRVQDQLGWYERKANWNKQRARYWRLAVIALEGLAGLLGLFRVLGWFDVDWLSIFAATAAVLAAWQQTKNYLGLSQSYAVTSHDVALVNANIGNEVDEEAWAQAVHDAEAAFSREHTLWRARRQGPNPN